MSAAGHDSRETVPLSPWRVYRSENSGEHVELTSIDADNGVTSPDDKLSSEGTNRNCSLEPIVSRPGLFHTRFDSTADVGGTPDEAYTLKRRGTTASMRDNMGARPFRIRPDGDDSGGEWLTERSRATEMLSLFFDVVVVAVLSVFSNTHKIQEPKAIPIFFSYYIIVVWVWTSQVHYDVRYEAEDIYHRFMKCLQIMVFVFMGASSGGWNPGNILPEKYLPDLSISKMLVHDQAAESFLTVLIAYIIYRAQLILEYATVVIDGRRMDKDTRGPKVSILTYAISLIINIIAVALPATNQSTANAKLGLFYSSIAVEIAGTCYQYARGITGHVTSRAMADRYGAQSLIILGEAFVSLSTAFNIVIGKVSVDSVGSYAQTFLVIAIICNLWNFLFSDFYKTATFPLRRIAAWEAIHFPLHFGILLLMAALVNVILADTFGNGLQQALNIHSRLFQSYLDNTTISDSQLQKMALYMDRLDLVPSVRSAYEQLKSNRDSSGSNAAALQIDYWIQTVTSMASLTTVKLSDDTNAISNKLYDVGVVYNIMELSNRLNATILDLDELKAEGADPDLIAALEADIEAGGNTENVGKLSTSLTIDLTISAGNDAYNGVNWLYPVAGGILILCSLRSMLRFETFELQHYIVQGYSLFIGLGLALLGLLAVGARPVNITYDLNDLENESRWQEHGGSKMMSIVDSKWSIAVIVFVYTSVSIVYAVVPFAMRKWRLRRANRA